MMSQSIDPQLMHEAVELLREAGRITLGWFGSDDLSIDRKQDGTPVTEADRAAERYLRERLAELHPDDTLVGEEEGVTEGTTGREWVIDPIDGTKAFTAGVPLYCNLLAMTDPHGPALGVINVPALDETVYAGRGLGCFRNRQPARVSRTEDVSGAILTTSGYEAWSDEMLQRAKNAGFQLRTWGDGYGYALVATGRVDVMVDPEAARWDLEPMSVILAEAGGRFSTLTGEVDSSGGSGVGSNGLLHNRVLALLSGPGV